MKYLVLQLALILTLLSTPFANADGKFKTFVKWCQKKLLPKPSQYADLERDILQSKQALLEIEARLLFDRERLALYNDILDNNSHAIKLYSEMMKKGGEWKVARLQLDQAVRRRERSTLHSIGKNIYFELNADLNQNKENIEKYSGGFDRAVARIAKQLNAR